MGAYIQLVHLPDVQIYKMVPDFHERNVRQIDLPDTSIPMPNAHNGGEVML
jgi:hypothetical protein